MPSNLILNTGVSVVGYNNKLTKATGSMTFGVNDTVNVENRSIGIKHNLGTSKVRFPHSLKPTPKATKGAAKQGNPQSKKPTTNVHEANLAALTIAAAGVGWWMFR